MTKQTAALNLCLARHIAQKLDDEFKMFLKWRGFNIDSSLFNLQFCHLKTLLRIVKAN